MDAFAGLTLNDPERSESDQLYKFIFFDAGLDCMHHRGNRALRCSPAGLASKLFLDSLN